MRAATTVILIVVLLLSSCAPHGDQSGNVPTRVPPADPVARFEELAKLKEAASFHVVYRLETNYDVDENEFAWLQDAGRVRWDDVNTRNGRIGGTSSIDDGAGGGLSCIWGTLDGNETADVTCASNPLGWGLGFTDRALNDYFRYPGLVEFRDYGTVLGVDVECFGITLGNMTGRICLSAEGVPLEVEAVVGPASDSTKYFFKALEIRPPPTDAELLTPIIPDAALGMWQDLRGVWLSDLALPQMPIVEEFFSGAKQ